MKYNSFYQLPVFTCTIVHIHKTCITLGKLRQMLSNIDTQYFRARLSNIAIETLRVDIFGEVTTQKSFLES